MKLLGKLLHSRRFHLEDTVEFSLIHELKCLRIVQLQIDPIESLAVADGNGVDCFLYRGERFEPQEVDLEHTACFDRLLGELCHQDRTVCRVTNRETGS